MYVCVCILHIETKVNASRISRTLRKPHTPTPTQTIHMRKSARNFKLYTKYMHTNIQTYRNTSIQTYTYAHTHIYMTITTTVCILTHTKCVSRPNSSELVL